MEDYLVITAQESFLEGNISRPPPGRGWGGAGGGGRGGRGVGGRRGAMRGKDQTR